MCFCSNFHVMTIRIPAAVESDEIVTRIQCMDKKALEFATYHTLQSLILAKSGSSMVE